MTTVETKPCTGCKRELPLAEFSPDRKARLGRTSACRECRTAQKWLSIQLKGCRVEGCGRPHRARGFCKPHDDRFTRFGDPMAGGPIAARRPQVEFDPWDEFLGVKTCVVCGESKLREEFYVNSKARDGLYQYCKPCSRAYQRERIARERGGPTGG